MSLNGESSFRLHVVGNLSKKRVMLIHGMGFDWKNCFGSIADELKKEFCDKCETLVNEYISLQKKIGELVIS